MKKLKRFFNADGKYRFEWNDLRAFLQLINVLLIVIVDIQTGSIFGFTIACIGFIKDCTDKGRRINGMVLHLLGIFLNAYFLWLI